MRRQRFPLHQTIAPFLFAIIGSCSSPTPKPTPNVTTTTKAPPPVARVKTNAPEITIQSPDGKSAYVVRAKESEIHVSTGGPDFGTMTDVEGDIIEAGKIVSRFQSPSAKIDRKTQTLELSGGVTITREPEADKKPQAPEPPGGGKTKPKEEPLVLRAVSVKFFQGLGRIEANGSVTVTSKDMVMGPIPRLWATRNLNRIATPGKFK